VATSAEDFGEGDDAHRIVATIREVETLYSAPVELVIVDTLSRAMAGGTPPKIWGIT